MTEYVVFRVDNNTHEEIYVGEDKENDDIFVTEYPVEAKHFATPREAYWWAAQKKLDWWKVGAR